jgi:hypothetical protein
MKNYDMYEPFTCVTLSFPMFDAAQIMFSHHIKLTMISTFQFLRRLQIIISAWLFSCHMYPLMICTNIAPVENMPRQQRRSIAILWKMEVFQFNLQLFIQGIACQTTSSFISTHKWINANNTTNDLNMANVVNAVSVYYTLQWFYWRWHFLGIRHPS